MQLDFIGSHCTEVIPRIFIGNKYSAQDSDFINRRNIKLVVCASNNQDDIVDHTNGAITVFIKNFPDAEYANAGNLNAQLIAGLFQMRNKADRAASLVNAHYQKGDNILIHCVAGINRSALIIGMFMIKYLGYTYADTILLLSAANEKRNPLLPVLTNKTFRAMLLFP